MGAMDAVTGADAETTARRRAAHGLRQIPAWLQVAGALVLVNLVGGAYLWAVHDDSEWRPPVTAALRDAVSVGVDSAYSCAVRASGSVHCWGDRGSFDPSGSEGDPGVATEVPLNVDATSVATGETFTCIVDDRGHVWCRGRDDVGQLGAATISSAGWFEIAGVRDAVAVTAGGHACALVAPGGAPTGEVRCWGLNHHGQLGDGTTTNRSDPVTVGDLPPVRAVSAGSAHTCAVDEAGEVWCWGNNASGQLGDGTTVDRSRPRKVAGITGLTTVSAGQGHTCAVDEAGTVWCWGDNAYGQLGDGSTDTRPRPIAVTELAPAVRVAAGDGMSCAIVGANREVACWGAAGTGLDPSTMQPGVRPVPVVGLSGVAALDVAGHACARLGSGTVECWGADTWLLGRGPTSDADVGDVYGPPGMPRPVVRVVPAGEEP